MAFFKQANKELKGIDAYYERTQKIENFETNWSKKNNFIKGLEIATLPVNPTVLNYLGKRVVSSFAKKPNVHEERLENICLQEFQRQAKIVHNIKNRTEEALENHINARFYVDKKNPKRDFYKNLQQFADLKTEMEEASKNGDDKMLSHLKDKESETLSSLKNKNVLKSKENKLEKLRHGRMKPFHIFSDYIDDLEGKKSEKAKDKLTELRKQEQQLMKEIECIKSSESNSFDELAKSLQKESDVTFATILQNQLSEIDKYLKPANGVEKQDIKEFGEQGEFYTKLQIELIALEKEKNPQKIALLETRVCNLLYDIKHHPNQAKDDGLDKIADQKEINKIKRQSLEKNVLENKKPEISLAPDLHPTRKYASFEKPNEAGITAQNKGNIGSQAGIGSR